MVNNLLLSVILGLVFVGTLYPLVAEALTGEKLSVGPPYFNSVAGPIALAAGALIMAPGRCCAGGATAAPSSAADRAAGPARRRWRCSRCRPARAGHRHPAAARPGPRAGVGAGQPRAAVEAQPAAHAALHLGHGDRPSRHRRRLAGMASESAFTKETLVAARPGETVEVGPWPVRFDRRRCPVAGPELDGGRGASSPRAAATARRSCSSRRRACSARRRPRPARRRSRPAGRPALHRARRAGRAGPLAAAAVVEAVRHPDLARRRAGRARRPARADRPPARASGAQRRRGEEACA